MTTSDHSEDPQKSSPDQEARAENLGCAVALLIAGGMMLASQLGWIKRVDWLLPAILIGWGVNYLYKAFGRR